MKWFRRRKRDDDAHTAPGNDVPDRSDQVGPAADPADAAARAATFWQRWDDLLPEVNAALGDGMAHRVDHQLAEMCAAVHPNLTISIERGDAAIYALVVSSQADPELRMLTDAWMAAAPEPDSVWEYHDAIPPVPDPTQVTVNLHGQKYALGEIRVAPQVDAGAGLVDVAVFHPGFAGLEDAERNALTFLPLEATLGERLAADRVGRVESAEAEPQGAIDLLEFRELVRSVRDAGAPSADGAEPGDAPAL